MRTNTSKPIADHAQHPQTKTDKPNPRKQAQEVNLLQHDGELPTLALALRRSCEANILTEIELRVSGYDLQECAHGMEFLLTMQKELLQDHEAKNKQTKSKLEGLM